MVQIPKNPCPAATDAAVRFFCAAGSLIKTAATSETTKKTVVFVGACLGSLYQTVRHSACMERCIKRLSKEEAPSKTIMVVDARGDARPFSVTGQPPADGDRKKEE